MFGWLCNAHSNAIWLAERPDKFGVGLAGGIETEGGLDHLVLQVAVDGLRATDDLDAALLLQVVLCQYTGVGVAVVASDDNYCLDTQLLANLDTIIKLPSLFQFGTSGTDDVETAGIAVLVDNLGREFLILAVNQTAGAAEETVQFVLRVQSLQTVEQTAYHVVPAGSLAARENDTYIKRLLCTLYIVPLSLVNGFHGDDGQTICVGEEFPDFLLVCHRLCFLAFHKAYRALQRYRHLRLIALTSNL